MSVLPVAARLFAAIILPKMLMACTRLLEARPRFAFFDHGACKRWYFESVRAETISNGAYVSIRLNAAPETKKDLGFNQSMNALRGRDLPLVITAPADAFYRSGRRSPLQVVFETCQ